MSDKYAALKSRIEKALEDLTNCRASMHVPVLDTDVDLVLYDCLELLERRERDKQGITGWRALQNDNRDLREPLYLDGFNEPCGWNSDYAPVYAAPPEPVAQPVQMPTVAKMKEIYSLFCTPTTGSNNAITAISAMIEAAPKHDGWVMMPAAYLDVIAAPKQEEATDKTAQQFESLGFVVTSDERKMEIPRCSKHPEVTLQTNPFELLMSYPPRPKMYCPECEPWVAERAELDKKLRRQGVR